MQHFQLEGRNIVYQDIGRGSPVVLAHCSCATHREWLSLAKILKEKHRVLAPDLIGYGKSDGWPVEVDYDPFADVNVIRQMFKIAAEPVHLIGHSYGGAMALEAARLQQESVKSLTLIEPVAFHLLRLGQREAEWKKIKTFGSNIINAVNSGNNKKAASIFMRYWLGNLKWWLLPKRTKNEIYNSIGKVAKEFSIMDRVQLTISDYQQSAIPTLLITGSRTRSTARAVTDIIKCITPGADLRIVRGAGHMSPFTHKQEINALISDYIARACD